MPMQKLTFRPGINVQRTQLLNEGGWSSANCIRFREGMPEVYGGWQSLGVAALIGIARGMHAWATLAGVATLAIGTNLRLYVIQSTALTTPANPFKTASGNTLVFVTDPGQPANLATGDTVVISGASAVGGVTPAGAYTIYYDTAFSNYAIVVSSAATSSVAAGGGTPTITYVLAAPALTDITPQLLVNTLTNPLTTTIGSNVVTVADGNMPAGIQVGTKIVLAGFTAVGGLTFPSGPYSVAAVGAGTFTFLAASAATSGATGGGTAFLIYFVSGPASTGSALAPNGPPTAAIWTLDNFGEDLIACFRGGSIYVWVPETGGEPAQPISGAPAQVGAIFVSNGAEQVVALGSIAADNPSAGFQPMLVSWCNSGDYTTWIASATNDAGNFLLTDGSQLMGGGRAAQQNLIWSDTALYSMQFIGGQLVYSFAQLGTACGLIGPQAFGIVNGAAFWMSKLNFMMYNGTVQMIDCPIWDLVFKNLTSSQTAKIICAVNSQFNEVRWDFPSGNGTGENDSFVVFNYVENTWTYSSDVASTPLIVARTAWQDVSVFGYPTAVDAAGNAWTHEVPNVYGAGTAALPWSLKSGDIDIAAGEQMMFVDWVLLDQIITGMATMEFIFSTQRYSSDAPVTNSGTFESATPSLVLRARGRQVAVTFANAGLPAFWRLGAVRIRAAPDGRN